MYSPFKIVSKYVAFWLSASNSKGHGVHAPFVYDFIRNVLLDKRNPRVFDLIEEKRNRLLKDTRILNLTDFGAGSRVQQQNQRMVKTIAASSLKPKKYSRLFYKMIQYYQPNTTIELGTSLGITTAYMASANKAMPLVSFEGADAVAAIAKTNLTALDLFNVRLILGNFDETLPDYLKDEVKVDLVFIDGNHRLAPTIHYFDLLLEKVHDQSILIFDDIHWSEEMEIAWCKIKEHPAVTLSIDLFFIGIVFFKKEFRKKQHFKVRF